jgi:hypothetical protein
MQKLKINFVDFWDNFDKKDNYFFHLLSNSYNVEISEDPDLLFFSVDYSKKRERNKFLDHKCKKIFFTGENVRPNLYFPGSIEMERYSIGKCDFSFSFDFSKDPRNYRLPLWILFINWFNVPHNETRDQSYLIPLDDLINRKIIRKDKFCNFIFSNNQGRRIEILDAIKKYKNVDCAGRLLNNTNYSIQGRGDQRYKVDFIKNYKFTISAENSKFDGYTTEKIIHPLSVGSIPIYWGSSKVNLDFNKKCFINVDDFLSLNDLTEHIKSVDSNKHMYEDIILQPVFEDGKIPEEFLPNTILKFFKEKIIC